MRKRKIKILFVTHAQGMGGANHSMFQLMKELRDNNWVEPMVLYSKTSSLPGIEEKCREAGIECVESRFYWFKGKKYWKDYIRYLLNLVFLYPLILWKLRSRHYDLVHSNGSVIDVGALISRMKHIPHVWHLREFGWLDFELCPILGDGFERWVYGKGDCFIAISKRIEEEFLKILPTEKVRLVYNGVVPKSDDLDSCHTNDISHFVIAGMIQETKNQMEAVKALEIVLKSTKAVHLDIIGNDQSDYAKEMKCYVRNQGLESYIKFWGVRNDVPQILFRMDVGLMLSKNEAFGRVTVEYMLQNLAVIASDAGANSEIIENGVSGLLYRLGDVDDLARKMIMYLEDKEYLLQIAKNGKNHALKNFTSERNTQSIYQLYNRLIDL